MERIGQYIHRLKVEFPTLPPLMEVSNRPFSPFDAESALHTIVEAYIATWAAQRTSCETIEGMERQFKDLQSNYKELEVTLVQRERQFGEEFLKLEEEIRVTNLGSECQVSFFRKQLEKN